MHHLPRTLSIVACALLVGAPPALGQVASEPAVREVLERIREEGFERSQIDELAGHLTDVIGPRLTGSAAMTRANQWTAERLRDWGAVNVQVRPWGEFGRGWERVSYSGRFLEPFVQPLYAQPTAWTGGTDGPVVGTPVIVRPESVEDVERYRGRVAGAILMADPPLGVEPEFEAPARRYSDEELLDPPAPPPAAPPPTPEERAQREAELGLRREIAVALGRLFAEERPAVILRSSGWPYHLLRLGGIPAWDPDAPIPISELIVSLEHYGQIWRNLERGVPVRLEIDVQNRFLDDDLLAYNTLADIPGSDLADELVMLGAHLDSWHPGSGATDNAAGSVITLEAMRILAALGVQPRRTIRIALWSGEEQGLLGSSAWVAENRDLWERISLYLNVDLGTGRIRGIWSQGNQEAVPVFQEVFAPLRDLGVLAVHHRAIGGTDHLSFEREGIPAFVFMQDQIEYDTRTHHSDADTFERLLLDDLRQAAVVVASTVYQLAMRDEPMPRRSD